MNLEYFKRKFDTLYKQNDTKREDIAAKTGIDKNKITKLRRMKYDTQPTIDDLIAISDYYHVTVDELLRPQEETEQNKEQEKSFDSLGDIAKSLFEIGKCIKLHLASINVEVGQTVRIIDGAFADYTGKITEIDNNKVKMIISMFGNDTVAEVNLNQIAEL